MLKVGTVLIVKNSTDDMGEGEEVVVAGVSEYSIFTNVDDYGSFTLEPDANGLSWKTFFTVKGL